jgi:hypothetical protein
VQLILTAFSCLSFFALSTRISDRMTCRIREGFLLDFGFPSVDSLLHYLHGSSQDSEDLIPMVTLLRGLLVCEYGPNYLLMQSPHVVEYQRTQLICVIVLLGRKSSQTISKICLYLASSEHGLRIGATWYSQLQHSHGIVLCVQQKYQIV